MNHKDNYRTLKNTLYTIETKGRNTLIMADCLRFIEQCIIGCEQEERARELAEMKAAEAEKGEEDVCHRK